MSASLQIQLLGGFAVTLDGQPIRAFRTAKTRALLTYLVVEADRQQSRNKLATLLWGELPDSAAKTNLRIELSNLKSLLADHPALEISRNEVSFNRALATTDVHTFQQSVASFLALPIETQGAELAKLTAALDLYQGEFLGGFHLNDAAEFEDWQLVTREQLHEEMMLALNTVQTRYAEQGRWAELADAARRQLAIVPWTESAHRNLMQSLAAQGQMQAALAQFEKCRTVLQEELGVEPSLATLEFVARLRGENRSPLAVQHNLSQPLKRLVGRDEDMAQLRKLVRAERLVTLLGIGGVGKSHLAQSVAQNVLHDFANGVWFVPLANVAVGEATPERIALAIAAAVGFQVSDMQAPLTELATYLSGKQMLFVLDNWEHLVDAAPTVLDALLRAPTVHVLATSRVRLLIEGERVFQLAGLPQSEAYTLFVERARRVVPAFATAGNGPADGDILAICTQVAGLPLGIELAASWVEHYSVVEIGKVIGEIAVQPQQRESLLFRHHSLSSVFEFSWQLLSPRQQFILAHLSIFRGGFDRVAAVTVAEGSLNDLSVLIAHSLVQRVTAGRYDLHPLIQEFSASKLEGDQAANLHSKYSQHYLSTLVAVPPTAWKAQLFDEFENIRSAWQHATQAHDATMIQRSTRPFGEYMQQFGVLADGNQLLADAVRQFEQDASQNELVAQLLGSQALFARSLEGLKGASLLQQRVLTLTTDPQILFFCHQDLANYYGEIDDWVQADFHFDHCEAIAEESGNLALYIESVEARIEINIIHFRGDFALAITRLQELQKLLDGATTPVENELRVRTNILQTLTLVSLRYGDYALAIRTAQTGIELAEKVGQRQRKMHMLLNCALAEQFAGLYDAAIAHNLESLANAQEIGDVDEEALLRANLCLTLRQSGALQEALVYGRAGIKMTVELGNKRIEGQARNRVGHTLCMLERWEEAYATYGDALALWDTMRHPNRYEAVAGRAITALHLNQHSEALSRVEEVLAFIEDKGVIGIVEPARLFLNCEAVLRGLGQDARAQQLLAQANAWMLTIAGRISDERVRDAFLNNRPDNQWLKARVAAGG